MHEILPFRVEVIQEKEKKKNKQTSKQAIRMASNPQELNKLEKNLVHRRP